MPQLKTVQLSQGPIEYLEQGEGRAIVFVHGLLVDNKLWQPMLAKLGQGHRFILPNWPMGAHTLKMKPQADLSVPGMVQLIVDFLEALELRDVILVGNDTGGALVQMVCAKIPNRISGAVLTTCDAYDVFPPSMFAVLKWLGYSTSLTWMVAQAIHRIAPLRHMLLAVGRLTDTPLDEALIAHWLYPLRTDEGVRHDVGKFLRTLSTRFTLNAAAQLKAFNKPVLLLWSTQSKHFPKILAERLQHDLPCAQLHWIDSAGIFLSLDYPDQVASQIQKFLANQPIAIATT